jgi:hypothetical protein
MGAITGGARNIALDQLGLLVDPGNYKSYTSGSSSFFNLVTPMTGVLANGTSYTSDSGGCWNYDGTNDWAYIPNQPLFNTLTDNFTVLVWINPQTLPGIAQRIFGLGYVSQWQIELRGSSQTAISVNYNKSGTNFFNTSGPIVTFDKWQQIGIHVSSGIVSYIYNGIKLVSGAFTVAGGFDNKTQTLSIGNYNGRGDGAYKGKISLSLIYNKPLSNSELLQNFNSTRARFGI